MTTNSNIRQHIDLPESRSSDDGAEPSASSLDQVRDILFGREIRDVEGRLEEMRGQINEQLENSRANIAGRIHAFEEFVKKRLDDVVAQIQTEREKRNTDLEVLNTNLRSALGDLQRQIASLDDSTVSKDAELRQHVGSEIQMVTNQLGQLAKEMRMAVLDEAEAIRAEKIDKETLVTLFSDLTQRLGGDRPNPGSD